MTFRWVGQVAIAFLAAVAVSAALGSVAQTQFNLSALAALGAPVTGAVRLETTLRDLAFFGPVMAAIVAAAFLPALGLASVLARRVPRASVALHALAAVAGLWAAFALMGFVTPMPTLVAAARTGAGVLALCLAGLPGGVVFALLTRRRF